MLILDRSRRRVQTQPRPPQRCPRCQGQTGQKWGRVQERPLTDVRIKSVTTRRYRCSQCGKTVPARPPGVGRTGRSRPFTALLGVLYALGLSHRKRETALALLGYSVDHVPSWRAWQRLGRLVRRRQPAGHARIVGVDETWLKAPGQARPVEMVVARDGRRLGLELTGPGFDYRRWFQERADPLGAEVVVTDDSSDYAGPIEDAGLRRQQCMAPRKRALGRWKKRLSPDCRENYADLLDRARQLLHDLPEGGSAPFHQWARDPALPRELRRLAAHFQERWRQRTRHQKEPEIPDSANGLEGKFGRIKPRYRLTRGLKSDAGAVLSAGLK